MECVSIKVSASYYMVIMDILCGSLAKTACCIQCYVYTSKSLADECRDACNRMCAGETATYHDHHQDGMEVGTCINTLKFAGEHSVEPVNSRYSD